MVRSGSADFPRVSGYSGLSAGRGRVTGLQLDVGAAGKGFQQRTGRMEIRDDIGQLRWAGIVNLTWAVSQG